MPPGRDGRPPRLSDDVRRGRDQRDNDGGLVDVPLRPSSQQRQGPRIEKWSLGILNDKLTEEVPGTVLLLASNKNEPLGMRRQSPDGGRASSMPPQDYQPSRRPSTTEKKRTSDGQIILDPQPDDSQNDPLNWPMWRRDASLFSIGFYCMVGGGMTPILAAGFQNVADDYDVSYSDVALTTGLYMMGLGVGSVLFSPTAILYGKRPVYIFSSLLFLVTSIWCAVSPDFASLATARVFQGIAVSPVECLPSATIAEIFFLHERAYRVGIYGLLLLGGKNLVPLVSAVIIQASGWRWSFYTVAIIVGFCSIMLFLFVPETFWDRTPRPRGRSRRPSFHRRSTSRLAVNHVGSNTQDEKAHAEQEQAAPHSPMTERQQRLHDANAHAHFETPSREASRRLKVRPCSIKIPASEASPGVAEDGHGQLPHQHESAAQADHGRERTSNDEVIEPAQQKSTALDNKASPASETTPTPTLVPNTDGARTPADEEKADPMSPSQSQNSAPSTPTVMRYTTNLRNAPPKPYVETLKVWNGRLSQASWIRVAVRPFILFAYPSVLWSTLVYSLSVGWLIVLSESVSHVYKNRESYNFTSLQVGLVYLSPFVGGVIGTAIAGKGSDIVARWMTRRNGGVYEPEFRLVMGIPIAISTAIGLMGFGWSAEERDAWIVPTIFFSVISFGCSLGATTSITFCVDSYRQFAGEALVTLNFSKNIFHGLVFSLFFPSWLEHEGSKDVFLAIGGIQVACLLCTIPMYIYGKRARMWTVRKSFMSRF